MKKASLLFLVVLVLILSQVASAACRGVISPTGQGTVTVMSPTMGSDDDDAQTLWDAMNVPAEDSMMGPGKAIVTGGKELNFICNLRGGKIPFCSITLNTRGPRGGDWIALDPVAKKMLFRIQGAEADHWGQKFHANAGSSFKFLSSDMKLAVHYSPGVFEIMYSEQGL